MRDDKPRFEVGYNGETEYSWRGNRYCCRSREATGLVAECEGYRYLVGTVYATCPGWKEFPPAELMAHFPGYVGARYAPTGETYVVETTCGPITVDRCVWEFDGVPLVEESLLGLVSCERARELDRIYAVG